MTKKEFDLEQELNDYPCPEMFKSGLRYHINIKNLKITSKKELEKVIEDFKKIGVGGD